MTPLVLIFGEILPKSIFQTYADQLAPHAIYALWFFRLLVFPLVALGAAFSSIFLRALRLESQRAVMSREELRLLLKLPSREDEHRITPEEKKMVTRIFGFKTTTVEDVMLPLSEVAALPVTAKVQEVAQQIADYQYTRIPLYEERLDKIVGVVHAYEILRAQGEDALRELCRPAIFVPESQPAIDTLVRLKREGHGMAVVVDEYGGATGVVTIEDILEEIVGEIEDEYDTTESTFIRREKDGSFRILGKTPVTRINEALKLNLPLKEDYESIAGLILDQLKRIPPVGEELILDRVILKIIGASERSIDEVELRIGRKPPLK
jgi:CBS domain containing-hemolysin-like protein